MTGGWAVSLDLMWDHIVGLLQDGTVTDVTFQDNQLIGVLTFDGREIGGRNQVYVGLKFPFIQDFGKVQSSDVIFPIAIFNGKDDHANMDAFFDAPVFDGDRSIRDMILSIRNRAAVTIRGQTVKLTQHFVADQKSMWAVMNCCQKPKTKNASGMTAEICSFCMATNHPEDKGNLEMRHTNRAWDLFDPALTMTFCLLHLKLRITEKLFQLAAAESYRTSSKTKLQSAIRALDVNMTIELKGKNKKKLSCTSMNGRDCEKLMATYLTWLPAVGVKDSTKAAQWEDLWRLYNTLFHGLNGRYDPEVGPGPDILEALRTAQVEFGETFLDLFDKDEVTPYIHMLTEHSVDHLERFKALWRYSNEGFEHSNKRHRYWYARCTQRDGKCGGKNQHAKSKHRGGKRASSQKQLMLKHLRILHYKVESLKKERLREAEDDTEEDEPEGVKPGEESDSDSESEDDTPSDDEPVDYEPESEDSYKHLAQDPLDAHQRTDLLQACQSELSLQPGDRTFDQGVLKLTVHNLRSLTDGHMIQTEVLQAAFRDLHSTHSSVLAVHPYWYAGLSGSMESILRWKETKEVLRTALARLTENTQGSSTCRYLAVAVHRPFHYALAVLDIDNKQWTLHDSLSRVDVNRAIAKGELNTLKGFFNTEARRTGAAIPWADDILPSAELAQQYDEADAHLPLHTRRAGVDCGIFVVAWTHALANNVSTINQDQMRTLRMRLALRLLARRQVS
jgi:hypothetical protein